MLILTESQIATSLTPQIAIAANAYAFYIHAHNGDVTPTRLALSVPATSESAGGVTLFKPSLTSTSLGLKIVSVRPDNVRYQKPTVPATIGILDRETGETIALIAATTLTGIRTAAGSAVATALFSIKDAHTLSVIGSGVQGREHIRAIIEIRPITTVYIFNRTKSGADKLATSLQSQYKHIKFHSFATPPLDDDESSAAIQALRSSQIICTCTGSSTPVLSAKMISPNTHINAVGSYQPHTRECTTDVLARSSIIMDDITAKSAGDIALAISESSEFENQLNGCLGDYIPDLFANYPSGKYSIDSSMFETLPKPLSKSKNADITFFKSVGIAVQDIITGAVIVDIAKQQNIGVTIDMDS